MRHVGKEGPRSIAVITTQRFTKVLLTRRCRRLPQALVCSFAIACSLVFGSAAAGQGQGSAADIEAVLEAEGFENLSVSEEADGQKLRIVFENRRYRWEVTGLGVVLALASARREGRLEVIPLHSGVPMARIEVDAADYRAFLRGEMSERDLFARMLVTNRVDPVAAGGRNASFGRVDLTLSPGVRLNLVTPAPPGTFAGGELRINPGVYAQLWRGLTFEGIYAYPLSSNEPRIARAVGAVNARIGKEGYFQAQAGRLAEGLNGFAAQASYLSEDGQHLLGLTLGQAAYPGMDRQFSYQAFYSWRPLALDATATVSAGRYLNGDTGYTLGLVSGFGERSIEFFMTKTSYSRTLGAGFTIPLGWMRQPHPQPVRFRFRNAFRFMYTDEQPLKDGGLTLPFNDGYQVAIRRWNRAYLQTYAQRLREAGTKWVPAETTELGE